MKFSFIETFRIQFPTILYWQSLAKTNWDIFTGSEKGGQKKNFCGPPCIWNILTLQLLLSALLYLEEMFLLSILVVTLDLSFKNLRMCFILSIHSWTKKEASNSSIENKVILLWIIEIYLLSKQIMILAEVDT